MTRSTNRALHAALLTGGLCAGLTGTAHAQDVVAEGTEEQHMHPPTPVAEQHPVQTAPTEPSWTDDLTIGAFVDAYMALRSDNNEIHDGNMGGSVVNPTANLYGHDAYIEASGFGLAFAGADVAYSGDEFGATISLRFGPGVNRFYAADQGAFGIDNITQGYLTWKPHQVEGLTIDLGQFYTIYGAEVAESWRNMNYSRGALYYSMQPFWHTGLKANYAINDKIAVNAMVVNGVNTAFEGNKSPSVGVQALITPIDELFVAVGYMTGLTPRDGDDETAGTKNFQDFFDLVATLTLGDFKLVANADLNIYRPKGADDRENWFGISVAPGYSVTNWFGVAARVEYLRDSINSQLLNAATTPGEDSSLTTLTATLDFKPVPNSSALILRPEFRYEIASDDGFGDHDNEPTDKFWSLHLGAVVTSM